MSGQHWLLHVGGSRSGMIDVVLSVIVSCLLEVKNEVLSTSIKDVPSEYTCGVFDFPHR